MIYSFADGYETTCQGKAYDHYLETGLIAEEITRSTLFSVEWYTDGETQEAEFRTKEKALEFAKKVNGRIYYYGY